jgi:hypothetical protein
MASALYKVSLTVILYSIHPPLLQQMLPLSWQRPWTGKNMNSAFEPWIGQAVVVQLTLGRIRVSLRGTLLKDESEILLVRPDAGSDVEIPKANVLAIEEAGRCCTVSYSLN